MRLCLPVLLFLSWVIHTHSTSTSPTLEHLVKTKVLTQVQAQKIIEELVPVSETASVDSLDDHSILGLISGSSLLNFLGAGALVIGFLLCCYKAIEEKAPGYSVGVGGVFGVLFYGAGLALLHQGSGIIASCLLIMSYCAWMLFAYALLAVFKLVQFYDPEEDFSQVRIGVVFASYSLLLAYFIARSCSFVLSQVPFFMSIPIISEKLIVKLKHWSPKYLQIPLDLEYAVVGLILLIYVHYFGPNAFLSFSTRPEIHNTDFQLMAYITGAILLSSGFSYYLTAVIRAGESSIRTTILISLNLIFSLCLLVFGFSIPSSAIIFLSMKWVSEALSVVVSSEHAFPGIFLVLPLVYLYLISNQTMQLVSDIFAPQAREYLQDSYLWGIVCYLLTLFSSLTALVFAHGISDVQVVDTSGDATQEIKTLNWGKAMYRFVLCYLLTVLLVILAEEESSWLISLGYLIFASISYWKVLTLLFVSGSSGAVTAVMCLSGIRIALLGSGFWTCLCLGAVLMVLSIWILSKSASKRFLTFLLAFILNGLVLCTSAIVHSSVLFAAGLLLSLQVLGTRLPPKVMLLVASCSLLCLVLFLGGWVDFYAVGSVAGRTSFVKRILGALSDPAALVPEKELVRRLFEQVQGVLLSLSLDRS